MCKRIVYITVLFLMITLCLAGCGKKKSGKVQSLYESGDDAASIVYVCTGPNAKAYHTDEDCKGLERCSDDIKEMTEQEAIDMGRHLCHYCNDGTTPY